MTNKSVMTCFLSIYYMSVCLVIEFDKNKRLKLKLSFINNAMLKLSLYIKFFDNIQKISLVPKIKESLIYNIYGYTP